jgi:PKD repeat protein
LEVAFDGSASSDSDGTIVSYAWDFDGDGTTDASAVSPSFIYQNPGDYTARLTVTDDDGATDVATTLINVNAPPPPPGGFAIGDSIVITVSDRWRGEPGAGVRGDRLPVGAVGVILGGPVVVNGETWWEITAASRQGWYLEQNLDAAP